RRHPDGWQGFLTQSGRKIRRQDMRGEILNRLLYAAGAAKRSDGGLHRQDTVHSMGRRALPALKIEYRFSSGLTIS
ncbi:MAG: hypothetical protein HFG09_08965, partial [Oscillibacter sp.]|nr:hypothetical protein [Oscillibacter sp.]